MFMDHREVGRLLDLFHIQEEAVGQIFWHENGWFLYNQIKDYIRSVQKRFGYKEVNTPQILRKELWERSGHWQHYKQNMFCIDSEDENGKLRDQIYRNDDPEYALKPMNCACHIQIFNSKVVSYRDLPLRYAEFGKCMRNEPSGSLSGLMRVRAFVQDDAHIFCSENQIQNEVQSFFKMADEIYKHFGFNDVKVVLSGRPEKSAGSDEQWEKAEASLRDACKFSEIDFEYVPGDAAFYGPKIELMIKDHMGREWQCGTIQVDFILPERLGVKYASQDEGLKHPVILHRAVLGSFERFIGILLENHGYNLPSWLNPRCLAVIDISEHGFNPEKINLESEQVVIDRSKDNMRSLIKKYSEEKYKYIIVYGKKEEQSGILPVNILGDKQVKMTVDELNNLLK